MKQASAGKHPSKTFMSIGGARALKIFRMGARITHVPKKGNGAPLVGIVGKFGNQSVSTGSRRIPPGPPMPWRARALLLARICSECGNKQRSAVALGWEAAKEYLFPRRTQLSKGYAAPDYALAGDAIRAGGISMEDFKVLIDWAARKHIAEGVAGIENGGIRMAARNFGDGISIAVRGGLIELAKELAGEVIAALRKNGENEVAQRIERIYLRSGIDPTKGNIEKSTMEFVGGLRSAKVGN